MKRLFVLMLVIAALAAAYVGHRRFGQPAADTLITAAATIGSVEQTVLASGSVRPVRLVAVGAQVSGRVTRLAVTPGQRIARGDLVAEIDSTSQQNSLRSAEASLQSVRAQRDEKAVSLSYAELTLTRQRTMLTQTATSRADFETAESSVKTLKAQIANLDGQIAQAEASLDIARVNLGYTRITAPIDGTVLAIVTQEGQTVNAVQSAPTLVVLGDLSAMQVRAEISEADVIRVKPGMPVYFTILGDTARRFEGRIETIDPAPESVKTDSSFTTSTTTSSSTSSTSSAIYYYGQFRVPNDDGVLRTYMTAQVVVVLAEAKGVVTVPSAAIVTRGPDGTATVQVIDDAGRPQPREVRVGIDNKVTAEIAAGLSAGERVVIGRRAASEAPAGRPGMGPPGGGL
ncbi:efflux RND transporter periplasmic adaptor subunit [Phreatobacter oligotrophus]|uniref:efflux RND transporter periplasmic adaptor subunit n=1 Tax=Phreatobacter oligotrophus TaxID=1122261 RepID=UPI002355D4FC|nr:efflux RND transporter periplasmic adaptor subunit [Phreatobacter oligotrophus]